ncbi:hypothetical protein N7468_010536 [Penicillium chermesinum]|uniref:Uncharacterized protein n=1 Tax=Penicillium chermesinum TaxID=63820 RepID=A0A9W9N7T8_9EURO|nr:uncharacterized protein N7468_010536 [Penicillium chermesinum]KAJ5214857.1 hypothetical protein N7468_010536 [Penicillium chermesinum]KAJ6141640.1 hypothetical protein N7470_010030 [Penicillium chermesinum]
MDARSEYSQPAKRQSRMKIDSLLNPPSEETDYDHYSKPSYHSTYSSPDKYWQYRYNPEDYHDVSPAASTATTHVSSASSSNSAPINPNQQHHMFLSYRPSGPGSGSARSSPDPYHPRERYDSVSSSSSTNGTERRRPPRPKYEEEEMYFIWYHRVDLCQEWKEVRESFNRQFPSRQRRGFQGIQCKFYRFIKEKRCPTLREQRRMRDGEFLREGTSLTDANGAPRFGVVEWANVWYPWMREDRETAMQRTS